MPSPPHQVQEEGCQSSPAPCICLNYSYSFSLSPTHLESFPNSFMSLPSTRVTPTGSSVQESFLYSFGSLTLTCSGVFTHFVWESFPSSFESFGSLYPIHLEVYPKLFWESFLDTFGSPSQTYSGVFPHFVWESFTNPFGSLYSIRLGSLPSSFGSLSLTLLGLFA